MTTETVMTHECGTQVRSIIVGYVHLLVCPLAPPRPERRPEPVEDRPQLLGKNPRHRVQPFNVTSALTRVE